MMRSNFFIFFLIALCNTAESSSFIETKSDEDFIKTINNSCSESYTYSSIYPYPVSKIYSVSLSKDCKKISKDLIKFLNSESLKKKISVGYQSKLKNIFFQDNSDRFYDNENFFFNFQGYRGNKSYKFKVRKLEDEYVLDESFFSIIKNNHAFTLGKMNHWWSNSPETSIMLSNASRPFPSGTIENIIPLNVRFLGNVNYKFLIGKLESNRAIPNAKFLGAKFIFQPNPKFSWGLSRTAQYGGDGRPENLDSFINLIIGRDNRNDSGITRENEPGNQMASLDMNFFPRSNDELVIYTQIAGEDESGYLPSRIIYNLGFIKSIGKSRDSFITVDFADTSSKGRPNYSYNHFLYLDGWRYLKKPIGAAIDADSDIFSISHKKIFSQNSSFKFKILSARINKNNSDKNSWSNKAFEINSIIFDISKRVNKNFFVRTIVNFDDKNPFTSDDSSNVNASFSFEYTF